MPSPSTPSQTESSILTTLLLHSALLPTILPLPKFTALFPPAARSNTHIPLLYRDLQHQRALTVDRVAENIAAEVKRGAGIQREVARARRRAARGEVDVGGMEDVEGGGAGKVNGELEALMRSVPTVLHSVPHTLSTLLPELESASADVEEENRELKAEAEELLREIEAQIGALSELRYGRFTGPVGGEDGLRGEVLEGLGRLGKGLERGQ